MVSLVDKLWRNLLLLCLEIRGAEEIQDGKLNLERTTARKTSALGPYGTYNNNDSGRPMLGVQLTALESVELELQFHYALPARHLYFSGPL